MTVNFRWLGINGFEFNWDGRTVLLDPCVTRGDAAVLSSPELVRRHLAGGEAIFVGHSHWDHLVDVPAIAAMTGGTVYGSRTTLNICRAFGTPEAQLHEIGYGDRLALDGYAVEVIRSEHMQPTKPGFYDAVPERVMERSDFLCGEVFAFLFHFPGHDVLNIGSANLDEAAASGVKADTVLGGVSGWKAGYPELIARCLQFRNFIPTHHDNFRRPLTDFSVRDDFQRFRLALDRLKPGIRYFEPEVLVSFPLS